MQTLLTNKNQSIKRKHRARSNITNLRIMKRKIISFVGLLLFVGVVVFNMHVVNSKKQVNELEMENIQALASESGDYVCCKPRDVKCVVGPDLVVWGTLYSGTSCPDDEQ
jgi:hypothetical protein